MPASGTEKSNDSSAEVLRFESVSMHASNVSENADKASFDFTLGKGELAVFEVPVGIALPDISGLATGLIHPARGKVKFCGTEWREFDQISSGQQRETIGQVFQSIHRAHWIVNLDIDENVYLAEQMTGRISQIDLVAAGEKLAQAFELDEIPGQREPQVSRNLLMRAQWVRAFLPNPLRLLILERPTFGVPADAVPLLTRQIERVRERDTAVIWVGPPLIDLERNGLDISHHFQSTPAALIPTAS